MIKKEIKTKMNVGIISHITTIMWWRNTGRKLFLYVIKQDNEIRKRDLYL